MFTRTIAAHMRDWEDLANVDPLYAILTESDKQFGKWELEDFFASGQAEIDALMKSCGFSIGDNGTALDFGCGVGRLSKALRQYFGEVYGVDISSGMIDQAKSHAPSCTFVLNRRDDLKQFADDTFDFVYSNIVLQHQPTKEIARGYIREFIRVLKPTGTAVFQMPYKLSLRGSLQPRRRLYAILRALGCSSKFIYNRLHLLPLRTISMREQDVHETVTRGRGRVLRSYPDNFNWHSMSYIVTKQ